MVEKEYIKDLKEGKIINSTFVVKFKKPVEKYAKGYKFELRIGDKTGEAMLKFWGSTNEKEVQDLYDSIKKDSFVEVMGKGNLWNNAIEISVNNVSQVKPVEVTDYSDFLPVCPKDLDKLEEELFSILDTVTCKFDFSIFREFKNRPAAMYRHHGYIGGLLEHTLEVIKICLSAHSLYPSLDRDLLILGALVHDIGKLDELNVGSSIKTSKSGILLGHISQGLKYVDDFDISEDLKLKLKHIILSHHGELEWGSPKKPAFPEALVIHLADNMSSRVVQMINVLDGAKTEDDFVYSKDFGNLLL